MRRRLVASLLSATCAVLVMLPNLASAGLFGIGDDELDLKSNAPDAATLLLGIRCQYEGLVTLHLRHVETGKVGRISMNHAPWPFATASDYGKVAFGKVQMLRVEPGRYELADVEVSRETGMAFRLKRHAPAIVGVGFSVEAGERVYVGNYEVRPSSGRNLLSGLHILIADWQKLDVAIARTMPEGADLPADMRNLVPREFVPQPGRLTIGREVSASLVRKYLPQHADALPAPEAAQPASEATDGALQGATESAAN